MEEDKSNSHHDLITASKTQSCSTEGHSQRLYKPCGHFSVQILPHLTPVHPSVPIHRRYMDHFGEVQEEKSTEMDKTDQIFAMQHIASVMWL